SRAPAPRAARAPSDARRRGGRSARVPAAASPRVRARLRSRLALRLASEVAARLREPRRRVQPGALPASPVLEELRPPPSELVRAGPPRGGFRRDVRRVARHAARRVAPSLPRMEGAREARVRRRAHGGGEEE